MTTTDTWVQTTIAIVDAERIVGGWTIHARIIVVQAQVPAERALIGVPLLIHFEGHLLPHLSLRAGLLARVSIPLAKAEAHLDRIADGQEPYAEPGIEFWATYIQPLAEPCVRVPLSVLRELRGHETVFESTRRALVHVWSDERRTGPRDERR